MSKGTRLLVLGILVLVAVSLIVSGCSKPAETPKVQFPERNLSGIIMWGAGGTTDLMARTITPLAEKELGKSVVLENKTGATGAIATQYVFDQPADGYTLLYGAENPQIYGVLEISPRSYDEFEPILVMARGVPVVVVPANSPYNTIQDLMAAAEKQPKRINMGSTGPGGIPFVVSAMIKSVNNVEFNMVPFDGDGPALTALLGGHIDVMVANLTAAIDNVRAGKVKALALVANEPVESLPGVPAIGQVYEGYKPLLPWGPYFGVFAKKGLPEETKTILVNAYRKAFEQPEFQDFMKRTNAIPVGLSGAEAEQFIKRTQQVTTWLLHDAGATKKSPEEFGIKRVAER